MWHPWRALRRLVNVDLILTRRLPIGVRGVTDGQRIWLDDQQLQSERRSTLAHELAHIELGHTGECTPVEEAQARALAARWLIRMELLLDALAWTENLEELADELWVDLDTLMARLDGLTVEERQMIQELYDRVGRVA